jgi:amino-acid N-acetyltransferase
VPPDGVDDHVKTMLVAREDGHLVGTAGLELYDDGALFRSSAADPRRRTHELTEAPPRLVERHRVGTVFPLTPPAERFLPRFGFEQIARNHAPRSVQASVEFRAACPASVIVMRKHLV